MTEKEFSKLRRRDLLELLLSQIQEDDRLERKVSAMMNRITSQEKTLNRLKDKLNEKDAQLEKLKGRLDEKDREIGMLQETLESERSSRRIELDEAGSIAEAALKLSGVFEAAQDAADRYMENIRLLQTAAEQKYRESCRSRVSQREAEPDGQG